MKRLLTVSLTVAAMTAAPAFAGNTVGVAVQNLDVDSAGASASPLSLSVDLRHDLSKNVYVGGQIAFALDDDQGVEVSQVLGVDLGLQHQFSHAVGVYGFAGLGMAKVDSGAGDGDGVSLRFGVGANLTVGRNGVLDIGWSSLFDDDMDFAGTDVPVEIAGPHVGLGMRF